MTRSSNRWIAIGTAIGLLALASVHIAAWALFEASDVPRGTVSFFLGVPASVRQLPIVSECSAPLYRWRGRDGERPPLISVSYPSRGRAEEIVEAYGAPLKRASCNLVKTDAYDRRTLAEFQCQGPEIVSISLRVGDEFPCSNVELEIVENY